MHLKVTLTLFFAVITVNNSENKFGAFKSKSTQNQESNEHTDVIKMEIKKYMSECGADVSGEDGSDSKNNNRNSSSNNNNNNYGANNSNSGRYDNNRAQNGQQNHGNNGYRNQTTNVGYGQNYGSSYPSHDYGHDPNRGYPQSSFGSWGSSGQGSYSNPHGNMDYNRSGYGSYNGNYGYGQDASGYGVRNAGNVNSKKSHYGPRSHNPGGDRYNFDGSYIRSKRADDDDMECISQCIFGYLEVLDDNRSPSESAVIKWFQDHLPNDAKRIKAIRDTRRCFARLAASDNDDGCDFSRSLSKCLNLEIEQ